MSPRPSVVAVSVVALALSLAGCGSTDEPDAEASPSPVSKPAAECREQWRELGEELADRPSAQTPSALPSRWNSVLASVDYYATSAKESDCDARLETQEKSIAALEKFAASLRRWDLEHQLVRVEADARSYAAGSRPPAPKGKKGKKASRPPRPTEVAKALATLTKQAPRATQQQGPGWQQAAATDIQDKSAVAKARKDLAFLSEESAAWRSGNAALRTINQALRSQS